MNVKSLMLAWKEYRKWLKEQGINSSNIQEKIPEYIEMIKKDPEKLNQLKGILDDKSLLPYAKQLNISENDISKMKSMLGKDTTNQTIGNLTPRQMEMIKKFKR